jgi:hypothetical protein
VSQGRPQDVQLWLRRKPSLTELRRAFPKEWAAVERDVAALVAREDPEELRAYLTRTVTPGIPAQDRLRPKEARLSTQIRQHMMIAAVNQACLAASTGVTQGKIRFSGMNGRALQKLLFAHGLERKPVSMLWFRLVWPLVRQRRLLMPLVRPQGIYCFYSSALVAELAGLIGDRPCLEIAAGDGTLTRFLTAAGVKITATDDHSWDGDVHYPDSVLRQNAAQALRIHKPEVVISAWTPPRNTFEKHVFTTPSVQTYITIGSKDESAAGNWTTYRSQTDFEMIEDQRLAAGVLPPELDGAVIVFQRRETGRATHSS